MHGRSWVMMVSGAACLLLGCETPPTMSVTSTPHASAAEPPTEGPTRARGCGPHDRPVAAVLTGEDFVVTFDKPLRGKAINQYWIALAPSHIPDSDTTGRTVLDRGITSVRLRALAPGDYEVRLYGEYPKKEGHLLARAPVTVHGWPVRAVAQPERPDGQAP